MILHGIVPRVPRTALLRLDVLTCPGVASKLSPMRPNRGRKNVVDPPSHALRHFRENDFIHFSSCFDYTDEPSTTSSSTTTAANERSCSRANWNRRLAADRAAAIEVRSRAQANTKEESQLQKNAKPCARTKNGQRHTRLRYDDDELGQHPARREYNKQKKHVRRAACTSKHWITFCRLPCCLLLWRLQQRLSEHGTIETGKCRRLPKWCATQPWTLQLQSSAGWLLTVWEDCRLDAGYWDLEIRFLSQCWDCFVCLYF